MKRVIFALSAAVIIAGCGGGSSSSSSDFNKSYTGKTTQATITADNARALSVDAIDTAQGSADIGITGIFKKVTDVQDHCIKIQPVAIILKNAVVKANYKPAVAKSVALTEQGTEYGYSGSYDYFVTGNDNTGVGSGTITFRNYEEYSGAPVISGILSFTVVLDTNTGELKSMTMSLNNISVYVDFESLTLNGSVSLSIATGKETMTMSIVTLESSTNKTYYIKDFKLELTSGTSLTISGTFYSHDYGYVVLTTVTALSASSFDTSIYSGELLFTGANGTKAKIIFPGPSVYWYNGTSFIPAP